MCGEVAAFTPFVGGHSTIFDPHIVNLSHDESVNCYQGFKVESNVKYGRSKSSMSLALHSLFDLIEQRI